MNTEATAPESTNGNYASPKISESSANNPDISTSPDFSDLCIVSPLPHRVGPSSNHTPTRTSLTPPPQSENINRAIRTTSKNLDDAVEHVQRYIFQGCPDSKEKGDRGHGRSPESDYSDDMLSPKVLPDFRNISPMKSPLQSSCRSSMESISKDSKHIEEMKLSTFEELSESYSLQFDNHAEEIDNLDSGAAADLMSKLQIDTNSLQDSDNESVESVMFVSTKPLKRRVIDDEESLVESINLSATDGMFKQSHNEEEEVEKIKSEEVVLDDVFSGMTLEDFNTNNDSILDADVTIRTINSLGSDDEDIITTDGCGCWTIDTLTETKDLHLPPESGIWPRIRLPFSSYQKLYHHQRIGIQWMASLHRNKIKGGILADDMGMGKTMQTLVYLGSLMRAETIHNALIVCPKSVVRNWEREANLIFKDIAPRCEVCAITSDVGKEKRLRLFAEGFCSSFKNPRLVVTTYGLISSHITELNNIASKYDKWQWCYVILDEGHCIKNPNTLVSKHVRIICRNKKTRRLLLTGTPIQNNLNELHSLFDWATAGQLLGSSKTFLNKYAIPIEEGRQQNASNWEVKKAAEMNEKLQQVLQPYFLQRLKSSEFQDKLPTKKELVVFVSLSKKQRSLYQKYLDGGMITDVLSGATPSPLTAIAHLKQLCGHPSLVRGDRSTIIDDRPPNDLLEDSAKLQVLFSLMKRLRRAGHRALIFSQSTKMLDIMERVFDGSFTYLRIDGQSKEKSRQRNVDDFNDRESGIDCMLLSTKAAGVGLTLNGADRAIIFDPSWNPAEDAQAVDRCYRIGQTKNVTVYRMITSGTVEEKIYEKQVYKDGIKRVLLTESLSGSTKRYFDREDLRDLFKLSPSDAPCSMLTKFNGSSAMGSSGKPSFLSSHPCVVGVASHDVLYNNASANDNSTVDLTSSTTSTATPFTRSPFKSSGQLKSLDDYMDVIGVQNPPNFKPLSGGLNRTRENRMNARAKHGKKELKGFSEATHKNVSAAVDIALSKTDDLITKNELGQAMDILLGLIESEAHLINGDTKLRVHEHIAHVSSKLGWL